MFISAKELMQRKGVIEERKAQTLDVTIKGLGEWRFRVPSASEIMDAQMFAKSHKSAEESGDTFLLYNQCEMPDLHDAQLQNAYGVHGCAIVHKLLLAGEVEALARALMQKAGYNGGTVDIIEKGANEVKN